MKKYLLICFFSLMSCENRIEKDIVGFWKMQQAYYNNQPVRNNLHSDLITFDKGNMCTLPTSYSELDNTTGHYEIIQEENGTFILIKTKNSIFNRKFLIKAFNKKKYYETGYNYIEAVLTADSLRLDLRKQFSRH